MEHEEAEKAYQALNGVLERLLKAKVREDLGASHTDALESHVRHFMYVADKYFEKASTLIADLEDTDSKPRAYQGVMRRLTNHTKLLLDIANPLNEILTPGRIDREVIEELFRLVTSGLGPHGQVILPVLCADFKTTQCNYVNNGVTFIGAPADVWDRMRWTRNIFALWHEVASIATAKREDDFADLLKKNIPGESSSLLEHFKKLEDDFARSILHQFGVEVELGSDGQFKQKKKNLEGGPTIDLSLWRERWLGEFFEDCYGIRTLKNTRFGQSIVASIRKNLLSRYKDKAIGDINHPPPQVRIDVAEFFRALESGETPADDGSTGYNVAKPIAEFCQHHFERVFPRGGLLIGNPSDESDSSSPSDVEHLRSLGEVALEAPQVSDSFLRSINDSKTIEELLLLEFALVDFNGEDNRPDI